MHTAALMVALVASAALSETTKPTWLTDYGQAQRQGVSENRPLAVLLAPGKDGYQKLVKEGTLDADALKQLAEGYVCVHLDTTTEYGKKWAERFEMKSGVGIVLSDRQGETQAYRHEGSLELKSLTSTLEKHSGKMVVRTSNYPAESSVVPSRVIESYPIQGRIEYHGGSPRTRSSYCPT